LRTAFARRPPAELRRDDDAVADRRERLAEQFLVHERAVHLRGVEERDTAIDGGTDEIDHLALVLRWPVAV
jgi:hypothetical protein